MEENRKDEVARDQGETDIDIRGDDGGEMERVNREVDRERDGMKKNWCWSCWEVCRQFEAKTLIIPRLTRLQHQLEKERE